MRVRSALGLQLTTQLLITRSSHSSNVEYFPTYFDEGIIVKYLLIPIQTTCVQNSCQKIIIFKKHFPVFIYIWSKLIIFSNVGTIF